MLAVKPVCVCVFVYVYITDSMLSVDGGGHVDVTI
jgi:hypothetical protein